MQNIIRSGTVQRNNAGSNHPRPQPVPSRQGMGCTAEDASGLGARHAQPSRARAEVTSRDPRGGQYTIGLFGATKSRFKRPTFRLRGLNVSEAIAARNAELKLEAAPCQQETERVAAPILAAADSSIAQHRRRDMFQAFVLLAELEGRPVGQVMAEWLSDCSTLVGEVDLFDEVPTHAACAVRSADDRRDDALFADEETSSYEFYAAVGSVGNIGMQLALD